MADIEAGKIDVVVIHKIDRLTRSLADFSKMVEVFERQGVWMGGVPPLEYDVQNRRLVRNEREAKTIRHIFQRFVELGSSTTLVKELKLDGVRSKAWITQDGKTRDGKPIDKGLTHAKHPRRAQRRTVQEFRGVDRIFEEELGSGVHWSPWLRLSR